LIEGRLYGQAMQEGQKNLCKAKKLNQLACEELAKKSKTTNQDAKVYQAQLNLVGLCRKPDGQ